MQHVGLDVDIYREEDKGALLLDSCNLTHRMIMKKFNLESTLGYLLDTFVTQNVALVEKTLPSNMLILNSYPNFDKGVNKVLKATTLALTEMHPHDS